MYLYEWFMIFMLCQVFMLKDLAAARCLYGAGADCTFRCHCLYDTECGGLCPSGCDGGDLGYNWRGSACQIGNVALGKQAQQTGTLQWQPIHKYSEAKNAVDGKLPTGAGTATGAENCAHPNADGARWRVDLGDTYKIYNVTIYFRRGCCYNRNSQFTISVLNMAAGSEYVCAYQGPEVWAPSLTLSCSTPLIGDRVQFIRDAGSSEQDLISLCEVIVMGHKYIDIDCESKCPAGVYCDDVIGCTECDGSYPPYCKDACDNGNYGRNCENKCGSCKDSGCDKSTGACPGCQNGYHGSTCHNVCHQNCKDRVCHQNTGYCVACADGYYGTNCQDRCGSCKDTACSKSSGTCSGCKSGYYGTKCRSSCNENCKDDVCHQTTGNCMGCESGLHGTQCQDRCGQCKNETCDQSTGTCPDGCLTWWINDTCQTKIDEVTTNGNTSTDDVSESSISISWPALSVAAGIESYYGYQVRIRDYKMGAEYQNYTDVKHNTALTDKVTLIVGGLESNTVYEIQIIPYRIWRDVIDYGQPYPTLTQKTSCSDPEQPDKPVVAMATAGPVIEVTYQNISKINSNCESITAAWLILSLKRSIIETLSLDVYSSYLSYNVNISGSYEVKLRVQNNEGRNSTSVPATILISDVQIGGKETPSPQSGPPVIAISAGAAAAVVVIGVILAAVLISKRRRKRTEKNNAAIPTPHGEQETRSATAGKVNVAVTNDYEQSDELGIIKSNIVPVTANPKPKPKEKPKFKNVQYENFEAGDHHLVLAKEESVELPSSSAKPAPENPEHKKAPATSSTREIVPCPQPSGSSSDEHVYGNTPSQTDSIEIDKFEAYVKMKKNSNLFKAEYESLPQEDKARCLAGQTKTNKKKNRFLNIYPYDDTRVILPEVENIPESDYINANYIKGFKNGNEYIATQGPKDITVGDFWRMIWQEGSNRIIMVANLKENGKYRCHPYWTDNVGKTIDQGEFTITTDGLEVCADYTTRILTVRTQNESRTVRQFHFTSWEDKNKPLYGATTLLCFFKKVHACDRFSKGPMIVHCSAGVGRTGTFIALDILQQQARLQGVLSIYSCVQKLRTQRMNMVQTQEQYIYLHDALVEHIQCGNTSYDCSGFNQTFTTLCQPDPQLGGVSQLEKQFKLLNSLKKPAVSPDSDGLAPVHRNKNRDINVIPDDFDRLYLTGRGNENYINAVFVDSFKAHDFYVVTQMPLPETVPDFWKLVLEQKTQSIVMLNQIPDGEEPYWPHDGRTTVKFGAIEVTLVNTEDTNENIIIRNFNIKNKSKMTSESLIVRHFQVLSWPNTEALPPHKKHLLSLMALLQDWYQQNMPSYLARRAQQDDSRPKPETMVHCLTGGVQSGVFCAVSHTLERMKVEQEIDAFLAARYITRRRPQYISTLAEYQFMYEMAMECMSQYDTYANFQ